MTGIIHHASANHVSRSMMQNGTKKPVKTAGLQCGYAVIGISHHDTASRVKKSIMLCGMRNHVRNVALQSESIKSGTSLPDSVQTASKDFRPEMPLVHIAERASQFQLALRLSVITMVGIYQTNAKNAVKCSGISHLRR